MHDATIPGYRRLRRIHESTPRVVYRAEREADGEPVVLKTLLGPYPGKQDVAELRREYQLTRSLRDDVEGVICVHSLVAYGSGNLAIEMEPFGISLAELMTQRGGRPLEPERLLAIAAALARILGRVHERDVVHKDVVPRNVLLEPATDQLRLIDFGIASELDRERQSVTLSRRLEGSLPYISPEQTGRMNRDLDYRSDYYSLGVTLFELATGRLPFAADSALEWVHRHISQPAPTAHAVSPAVPEALSCVIAKLMAKDAEDRYQSTYGLVADLERCARSLRQHGVAQPFALGQDDVSRRFQLPQKLYGRERELAVLRDTFDEVARGATRLCVISGSSGVGKSALANELSQSIVREQGYLIQGKFDQFQQSSAYGALATAFRSLVQQLLGEPRARLEAWRRSLEAALGQSAQLIVELVPELELVIGKQPPVPALPPTETQNRFQLVFTSFVKVLATERHPLVVFMDDLQWSDVPTLGLLQRLVTARELGHLLVIGAYRSNHVDARHPLRVTLDEIEKSREIVELRLRPLEPDAVERLIADALACPLERARPLSELVYAKARGNPFFINELLKSLKEEGAIAFDPEAGRWWWNEEAVRRAQVGDNVVDFMVANLRRLHPETQAVLQLAACIGSSFDLKTLAIIHERAVDQTAAELHEALRRNIVVPLSESYALVGLPGGAETVNPTYKFQHDRIQQAAYALIDDDHKQAVHLSIGRLMQRHSSPAELRERLFDVVGHLDAGRRLIHDPHERRELARMNLAAGIAAQRSSAYESALGLLRIGRELLPDDAWESDYELMLALCREYQQCAYLTARHDEAEAFTEMLLARVHTPLEQAEVLSARTRQYATMGKMRESIEAAIAGLSLLGVDLRDDPGPEAIAAEVAAVEAGLAGRRIADLIVAPPLTDPRQQVAIRLLMEIFPAAFLSGSGDLFPYLVLKSVNISLRHGNSPESAFAYAAYGMLLCGLLDDPALGHEYGRLAVAMNDRLDDIALKSRVIYVHAMFIHHWSNHWSSMTPWFQRGIEAGYQSGDLLYLAYSAQDCVIWDPTLDLETASREQRKYLTIVKDCEYQDSYDSGTLFLQMLLNFQGLTDDSYSMNDADFDEQRCVEGMRARRFMTGVANHHIYKAEIHWFYDDPEGALEHVRAQDELVASSMSLPQLVRFHVVAFLVHAALFPGMDEPARAVARARMEASLARMSRWASHCAENFAHLREMMCGELARLDGDGTAALRAYERAIELAGRSGFRRDEAMAHELAAKHLLREGLPRAAEGYLHAAFYLYDRWGARRKLEQLERRYPQLLRPRLAPRRSDRPPLALAATTTTNDLDSASLDMASVMKASQAISGEIVLEQLWKTSLQILLENAGGQVGYLVVRKDGELVIQARSEVGRELPPLPGPVPVHEGGGRPRLPVSVLDNVLRTGVPLVLHDATDSRRFSSDPYVVEHRPRSVLCIPIRRHERFEGAIYMENALTKGAFTEERVEVIKLLSAQAAISMENAEIHAAQLRLTAAQQRFVPSQFLESLGHHDIARVGLGEYVAKEMSVMFADLRNFTPLTERLGPGAIIELLNRYFSRLGEPIAEAGGFIDSYNGDEIMALFDVAPDRAVAAGVAMRRALEHFNRESAARGGPALEMGIGLNTGPLVLGTVGSRDRLKCGVVGDTVNLASRIEQLTKLYRAPVLVGESTVAGLRDRQRLSLRMVDRVAVKGKQRAVVLYEVLDAETPARRAAKEATRELMVEAMENYAARAFERAHALFRRARDADPEDAVAALFVERAARYAADPPPSSWPGFETLEHK